MSPANRSSHADRPRPEIRPRAFPFRATTIPRRWLAGNGITTALVNGVNLLFPAGERFFIRSVRHYLPMISDAELCAQVHGFFGQEGRHSQAHERVFTVLREQGYELDSFLRMYDRLAFQFLERIMPPAMRLATTAAAEHFTAIMAENLLRMRLAMGDPEMEKLLLWHAAEEIEHKAVAFDVLAEINPGYPLRIAGLAMATSLLGGFWFAAVVTLLLQDRAHGDLTLQADLERTRAWRQKAGRRGIVAEVFVAGIREYLRRDFHPNQRDNLALAKGYLASVGM